MTAATMMRRCVMAGGFQPSDLSIAQMWHRADDIGAAGVADGGAVSSWVDRIAGLDFVQASGTLQPLYRATGLGGKPAVEFDGSDDRLVLGSVPFSNTEGAVLVVARLSNVTGVTPTFLSTSDEGGNVRYWECGHNTSVGMRVRQRNNDTADNVRGTTTLAINTDYLFYYSSNGTAYSYDLNGAAQTINVTGGADTGDWFGDTTLRDNFCIGCSKPLTPVQFCDGKIAEIIVLSTVPSATQLAQLERYVAARYGITIS